MLDKLASLGLSGQALEVSIMIRRKEIMMKRLHLFLYHLVLQHPDVDISLKENS